jgi:CDP-paratose 2-epimerase
MSRYKLVVGGAGFVGSNLVQSLLGDGYEVVVFDAFLRSGTRKNIDWLKRSNRNSQLTVIEDDIRNFEAVQAAVANADTIYDLAGQVAVTSSVADPRTDFDINAIGTFNVLEAARLSGHQPKIIFTSTNKVYGGLDDLEVIEEQGRYHIARFPEGISEARPLDFHSPYGCSKGAADQYVRDYARIYDLPTVVFRMSCIYGPRQFGNEDQGWVAHFVISALTGRPITIYGDGKQVRDVLFVDDLIRALRLADDKIDEVSGEIFNIGGGAANAISVWSEFGERLQKLTEKPIAVEFEDWRPGDQRCYISNIEKARQSLGWTPLVSKERGIELLADWVSANLDLFSASQEHRTFGAKTGSFATAPSG